MFLLIRTLVTIPLKVPLRTAISQTFPVCFQNIVIKNVEVFDFSIMCTEDMKKRTDDKFERNFCTA